MPKRPLALVIVSFVFLVSPLFVITQAAVINRLPLLGYGSVLSRLSYTDILVLSLYLLGFTALFFVKKWGWYSFVFTSLMLIAYNLVAVYFNPRYSLLLLLVYNLVLAGTAAFFFRRTLMAPFFNPRIRWWEGDRRYKINIYLEFGQNGLSSKREIIDISTSGCFISSRPLSYQAGDIFAGVIHIFAKTIPLNIKTVRYSSAHEAVQGYGLAFLPTSHPQKQEIAQIIKTLELTGQRKKGRPAQTFRQTADRYSLIHYAVLGSPGAESTLDLLDLSVSGCLLENTAGLTVQEQSGASLPLKLYCMSRALELTGKVAWKTGRLLGLEFCNLPRTVRDQVKIVVRLLHRNKAPHRNMGAARLSAAELENSLEHTPYWMVKQIKAFFKR